MKWNDLLKMRPLQWNLVYQGVPVECFAEGSQGSATQIICHEQGQGLYHLLTQPDMRVRRTVEAHLAI